MEQKDKELLLKDLCGRLPYGVKVLHIPTNEITTLEVISNDVIDGDIHDLIENFRPYLYSMSDITEKQEKEFLNTCNSYWKYYWTADTIDWFNKNHIDYRGLIPAGLAINAAEVNIY